MKPSKYIIYIDNEWVNLVLMNRLGRPANVKEQLDFISGVKKQALDFVNGNINSENSLLFVATFAGADGHRHRAIDIVALPGSHSSTKPLKRLKQLRKRGKTRSI